MMAAASKVQLLLVVIRIISATAEKKYPLGDIRNCPTNQLMNVNSKLHLMDVIPGMGFDNLRNIDVSQVYNFNYSTCHVSADGLYLLPDDVYLIPIQNSEIDVSSQVFQHFNEHTSETANSINIQGHYGCASGKFSADFQTSKMNMVKTKSISTRVQVRHTLYTVKIQSDAQLHPHFKSRIMDLTAYIQNKNTKVAHYLADELVRDYGTHVVTSIDAGAAISQTTMVSSKDVEDKSLSTKDISVSARAKFLVSIQASYDHSSSDKNVDAFNECTSYSHISTHGGPPFQLINFTMQDWENGVLDHLTALDRLGQPLYTVLTSTNMPELTGSTLESVVNYLYLSVEKYYDTNTHFGCTDPDDDAFNFYANVEDKTCKSANHATHFSFGGIFQHCQATNPMYQHFCSALSQANPLTGDYTCPDGYDAIPLHQGTQSQSVCTKACHRRFIFFKSCKDVCTYGQITYSGYWCAHNPNITLPSDAVGYMFGGVYTSVQRNPITRASTCPMHFLPLHVGEDLYICVSDDERGAPFRLPFGGFYSCTNGNGLASSAIQYSNKIYPKACPTKFDRLLATVDEHCQINYCTSLKDVIDYQPHPPILPPYRYKPVKSSNNTDVLLTVYGTSGRNWIKNGEGEWVEYQETDSFNYLDIANWVKLDELTPASDGAAGSFSIIPNSMSYIAIASPISATSPSSNNSPTNNTIPIIVGSVFGTFFVCSIVVVAMFGISKIKRKKKAGYLHINESYDPADN